MAGQWKAWPKELLIELWRRITPNGVVERHDSDTIYKISPDLCPAFDWQKYSLTLYFTPSNSGHVVGFLRWYHRTHKELCRPFGNPKNKRKMKSETKEQVLKRLREKYDLSLPRQLDSALYSAQQLYPEITKEDLLNTQKR